MSEEKKVREFWLSTTGNESHSDYKQKHNLNYDVFNHSGAGGLHVIEHSAYLAVKQELDAARTRERFHIQTQSELIDRASNFAQQLADAKAQIAEYEAALNECAKYSKLIGDRKSIVEGIVEKTLNKWKAK